MAATQLQNYTAPPDLRVMAYLTVKLCDSVSNCTGETQVVLERRSAAAKYSYLVVKHQSKGLLVAPEWFRKASANRDAVRPNAMRCGAVQCSAV